MSIGPCIVKPPCRPTIVWPPISMVGAPSAPRTPPRFAMKNASLPRPNLWPRLKYPRSRSNSVAFGSYSNSTKKLKFGVIARETKSSTSSGGSNFTSVSRLAVLEQAARDMKGEAVDHRLESPVVLEASDEAVRTRRARNLKAHHVELLPEPVQARGPRVAGVALHVVLARERGDRVDGSYIDVCQQHSCENGRGERTPEQCPFPFAGDTPSRQARQRTAKRR